MFFKMFFQMIYVLKIMFGDLLCLFFKGSRVKVVQIMVVDGIVWEVGLVNDLRFDSCISILFDVQNIVFLEVDFSNDFFFDCIYDQY